MPRTLALSDQRTRLSLTRRPTSPQKSLERVGHQCRQHTCMRTGGGAPKRRFLKSFLPLS